MRAPPIPAYRANGTPRRFRQLFGQVGVCPAEELDCEPWFAGADLPLPASQDDSLSDRWHERCCSQGIRLRSIRADVVLTRRFNAETRANDSKGRALSDISMRLLRHVWLECAGEEHDAVLILADKHGGRNRYHEFLPTVFGDTFIRCMLESMEKSRYRVANAEIRFETKSERHLPVALASMVCKYLRELSMKLFNQYWAERQPGLKPTAGYPLDAGRFRDDIAVLQRQLGIDDEILWRAVVISSGVLAISINRYGWPVLGPVISALTLTDAAHHATHSSLTASLQRNDLINRFEQPQKIFASTGNTL